MPVVADAQEIAASLAQAIAWPDVLGVAEEAAADPEADIIILQTNM